MQAELVYQQEGRSGLLAKALIRELEMMPEDAIEVAELVLAAFDGEEELDDDELSSDLRSVVYTLEDRQLLDFRREEYRNEEGHIRRAFFWSIRWDQVAPDDADEERAADDEQTVYDELPSTAWSRTSTA